MSGLALAAVSALWFGILTSVSPCPLATNITAISFVGRRTGSPIGVLLSGLLYTLGRALVYTAIGILLVSSLLSAPTVSLTLQTWMNKLLGPILILVGMVMLGLLRISFRAVSATLFFGSLLPLAVKHGSGILLPFVYGIGTAIPVVIFAIVLAFGARWLGKLFERVTQIERWMRTATGIVFIGVGVYMSLVHVYRVL